MEAICDLEGAWRPLADGFRIPLGAVAAHDLNLGMRTQPRFECRRLTIGQQINDTMALPVDNDRSKRAPSAVGPVVDANDVGKGQTGTGSRTNMDQHGIGTTQHAQGT